MSRPVIKTRRNRPWKEEDLAKIAAMLMDGKPVAEVAKALDRTVGAIRIQATKLRVSASANLRQRAMRNEGMQKERG